MKFFLLSILLCNTILVFSQKDYNKIMSQAILNIYENPDKAIDTGLEVYNASDSNLEQKVDALMLISTAYSSKRNYVLSLEYANKSLEFLPQIKNQSFKIKILNKVGAQYQHLKVYDKAIVYLDDALEIVNKTKNKDSIANLIGFNYGARGFIYREQMSCEIALNYFNKSLYYFHEFLKIDPVMNANISIINYNKGNCFITISKIDSAKVNFNKAYTHAQITSAKSLQGFAKKGLGEVYTLEGKFQDALAELKEGLLISSQVGDLILNQGIYKGLSDNYLAINDNENYQLYKKKFENTALRIKNNENTTINNSLVKLMADNKEELIAMHTKINTIKITFIFSYLLFSIIIARELFLYHKNRNSLSKKRKILENF